MTSSDTSKVVEDVDKALASVVAEMEEKGLPIGEPNLMRQAAVLDALKAIREVAAKPDPPSRWPPVVIFVVTAALLGYLLGKPNSALIAFEVSTRTLDLSVSSASKEQQALVPFSTTRISAQSMQLVGTVTGTPRSAPMQRTPYGVALTAEPGGRLVIEEIHVLALPGKDTKVMVTADEGALQVCTSSPALLVQIRTEGASAAGLATATLLQVASPPEAASRPAPAAPRQACMSVGIEATTAVPLTAQLRARDVSVSGPATVPKGSDELTVIFPSSLLSGKLTFPEVPGTQYKFEADNRLGLAGTNGVLRSVDWHKGQLNVSFTGTAASVTRSAGQIEQKLIPSRLSHMRASQSELILAWGTLLYILGLAISLMKWIGGKK